MPVLPYQKSASDPHVSDTGLKLRPPLSNAPIKLGMPGETTLAQALPSFAHNPFVLKTWVMMCWETEPCQSVLRICHSSPSASSRTFRRFARSSIDNGFVMPPTSFRVSVFRLNMTASSDDFQAGILLRRLRWIVKRSRTNDKTNVAMGTIIQAHCIWMYTSKELDFPDTVSSRSEVVRSLIKPLVCTGSGIECREERTH